MSDKNRRLTKLEAAFGEMDRSKRKSWVMVYEPSPTGPRFVDIIRSDELEGRWERNGKGEEFAGEPFSEEDLREALRHGGKLVPKQN